MNHFTLQEFACRCGCGRVEMNGEFLERLDQARDLAGAPFHVTSGFRCPAHNLAVGGVPGSSHTKGRAVDIACPDSRTRALVLQGLIRAGFGRLGLGKDFIHADLDPDKPSPAVWTY